MLLAASWHLNQTMLSVVEPTSAEVAQHAAALCAGYIDPANVALMGNSPDLTPTDVQDHYQAMAAAGGRAFLLFCDGQLVGDADWRGLATHGDPPLAVAEFAFMIAAPGRQGRGLGTAFARMLHHVAFAELGIARAYASVVPHNQASLRVFEKLGYQVDNSPAARAFAEAPDDVVLALVARQFAAPDGIVVARRDPTG